MWISPAAAIFCGWVSRWADELNEEQAKRIRTLELLNTSSGGGARVYDMYVRVPATSATGIVGLRTTDNKPQTRKFMENGLLIIEHNGQRYDAAGRQLK